MIQCEICPHACRLEEGQTGLCRARANKGGRIQSENYGLVTSLALDPIEKKPLYRFYPGSCILSVGSYGCNFRCSFCQNHEISMCDKENSEAMYVSPRQLVNKALELVPQGNIGLAFTYNEPLIGYEYVLDCSKLSKEQGLKNVVVTNGFINKQPLLHLLPYIDAMNIDLKGFSEGFYKSISGQLQTVMKTIETASKHCHVEVTTLIIPGENDSKEEMLRLSEWLASIDKAIPLHITRFFPRYRMTDKNPTPVETIHRLSGIAKQVLLYVYEGNI